MNDFMQMDNKPASAQQEVSLVNQWYLIMKALVIQQ